jgi:prevent-host-death family protein
MWPRWQYNEATMRRVGIRELKDRELSRSIRRAQMGEEILITDRGVPVAKLVPAALNKLPDRLQELVDKGLVDLRTPLWDRMDDPVVLRPGAKTGVDYVRDQRR